MIGDPHALKKQLSCCVIASIDHLYYFRGVFSLTELLGSDNTLAHDLLFNGTFFKECDSHI